MAVEKIILDIRAQVGKAKKDIDSLKNKTKGLNKEVDQTTQLMKKAGTAMLAFASIGLITKALNDMIKLNVEFEKTLTNVLTLLDKTSRAKFGDFLSTGALITMRKYGLEVADVNKALFDTISAGIKAGNSIIFLDKAATLAVGGVTDLSTAVDGMTSIMNAYKLSIEDANKVAVAFFSAQKFGTTTVQELAQNVGMVAPIAKAAGVSFQEMLAALALLTKVGLSTDIAATALRATISALINTTTDSEKAFKSMGIETGITALRVNGLGKTLTQIAKAVEDNADLLTQFIPNVRALTAVAALGTEALVEYDEILRFIMTDTGEVNSLTEALELQMRTMAKQVDVTKGAWKEFRILLAEEAKKTGTFQKLKFFMLGVRGTLISMSESMRDAEEIGGNMGDMFARISPGVAEFAWQIGQAEEALLEAGKVAQRWWELDESELTARQKKLKKQWDTEGKDRIESLINVQLEIEEIQMNMAQSTTDTEKLTAKARLDFLQQIADEEIAIQQQKTAAILMIISNFAFAASAFATQGSTLQKALAIADTTISTFFAAQKAYQAMVGVPIIGPTLAIAAASSAIASGLANVAAITGIGIPTPESFGEGGFTGKSKYQARDKDGRIAGYVHEDEFVFNKDKTRTLRPLFEDIHNNRIDIHGLAALTRRGTMKMMPKLNADILERQVEKIYRKMSEEQTERPVIIHHNNGYTKTIGNTTINVST